ncbi:hypothetical protein GCM10027511_08810 [Hymenobacter humi]
MIKTLLSVLLLALHTSLAFGQATPAPTEAWQSVFFDAPSTALPLLTAAAIKHSAQLKATEYDKAIGKQNVQIAKENILGSLGIGANYNYGNVGSIGTVDPASPNPFNTTLSSRYSTGVNFSLPLGTVVSRGNQIKREQLNYERTEALRQDQENQLRQQVINLYQSVLLARKVLTLQQEAYVNVRTNNQLAEKQFRQGQLTLTELSGANSSLTAASISQESARNQYDTAFMILEEVVGAKISTLMTTR